MPDNLIVWLSDHIASATSRIDWSAWEAIGTVGALWFLVVEATRNGRAERLRADGVLTTLVGLIEPVGDHFYDLEPGDLDKDEHDLLLKQRPLIRRALTGLAGFNLHDFATVGVSEWAGALPVALEALEKDVTKVQKAASLARSSYFSNISYVREANEHFRELREIVRYGRLGAKVVGYWRSTPLRNWWILRKLDR